MKLIILIAIVAYATADVAFFKTNYPAPKKLLPSFVAPHLSSSNPIMRSDYQTKAKNIAILHQDSGIDPEGSYQWSYEAENGIVAQEQASIHVLKPEQVSKSAQGSFQYTSPDGTPISVSYIADENGFQPQGAHLPVPPPIPVAIQRALDWIAAHPQPVQQNSSFRG